MREANNLTSDILQIGQVLVIPTISETPIETEEYVVKRGDSLWTIAQAFNTTVSDLRSLNNLTTDILQIGQILKVPKLPVDEELPDIGIPTTYTVQSGDSLWSIARKFDISVDALKQANNLTSNLLQIGQILTIPTGNQTLPPSSPTSYTVKKGDSLWSIARTFGVTVQQLRDANNLTSDILQVGQILQIPNVSL